MHDAKKGIPEQDPKKVLENKRISIRMQQETNYLNPSFPFNIKTEKRSFYFTILKHSLKGYSDESKFYREMFSFFKPKFAEIENLRNRIKKEKHVFLELEK